MTCLALGHRVRRDFRGLISLILFYDSECRIVVENWEKIIFDPKTGQKKSLGWQNEKRATPREHVRLINNIFRVVIIYLFIIILFIFFPLPFFSKPVFFFSNTIWTRQKVKVRHDVTVMAIRYTERLIRALKLNHWRVYYRFASCYTPAQAVLEKYHFDTL